MKGSPIPLLSFEENIDTSPFPQTLLDYSLDPDKYVHSFHIVINGKKRRIVTYRKNKDGDILLQLHRLINYYLSHTHIPSSYSFAYQKEKNVKLCLENHLQNDSFLKSDIHSYFESIDFGILCEKLQKFYTTYSEPADFWKKILGCCYYDGKLPIGFVTSPVLSDIYLRDVDEKMGTLKNVTYTRYADDFILSAVGDEAETSLKDALALLEKSMQVKKLELNHRKTYFRKLNHEGDAIHVLGLNLVRTGNQNEITVSDKYIRETSKELCRLISEKDKLEDWEARKRFCAVSGKIQYILNASERSAQKLRKMIAVKTGRTPDLSHKALMSVCVNDKQSVFDYQNDHFAYWLMQNKKYQEVIKSAYVWEKEIIEPFTDNGYDIMKFLFEEIRIPRDNGRSRRLSRLRGYLHSLAREVAEKRTFEISPFIVRLSIGDEVVNLQTSDDVANFRMLVRKLKTTKEPVEYYGAYHMKNLSKNLMNNSERMLIKRTPGNQNFRPFLRYLSHPLSCAVLNTDYLSWEFDRHLKKTEIVAIESDCNEWNLCLELEVGCPLQTVPSDIQKLTSMVNEISSLLNKAPLSVSNKGKMWHVACKDMYIEKDEGSKLIRMIHELYELVEGLNGYADIKGHLVPSVLFDSKHDSLFECIYLETNRAGRLHIRKVAF